MANAKASLDKSSGLTRKDRHELVDKLRKNLIYQTPRPIFSDEEQEHPTHVEVRFVFQHHQRILELLHKAGGWVLPQASKEDVLKAHEERCRRTIGDGIDYDLSGIPYGDLVAMHTELEGIEKLAPFRDAITEALQREADTKERPSKLTEDDVRRMRNEAQRHVDDMDELLRKSFGPVRNIVLR